VALSQDQLTLYFIALILSGRYIELKFAIKRNTKKESYLTSSEVSYVTYLEIAEYAINKKFEKLISKIKEIKH
jgi:hypothetical protein